MFATKRCDSNSSTDLISQELHLSRPSKESCSPTLVSELNCIESKKSRICERDDAHFKGERLLLMLKKPNGSGISLLDSRVFGWPGS